MMHTPAGEARAYSRVSMRRIAGLDGLRAIAAGLVLVYHLIPGWAGLGYVGVDIFFVLSGFLITSLLIVSAANHESPQLVDFWARRFRRLFPAVFVATIGSAALAFLVGGDALVALGRQVFGSLTATYNWVEIAAGSTYFEQSSPLLLTNMWSLAVEQQFYLVWPIIVLVLVRFRRHWRIAAALAIAGASIALHTAVVGDGVARAYMGTDTHLWGLMFGAVLAFAMQKTVVGPEEPVPAKTSRLWGTGGWLGLVAVATAGLLLDNSDAMYPWGMVGASLLAVLVIRALLPDIQSREAELLRTFLGSKPLTWLGVRSYGIYLWHWPLYVLLYYQMPLLNPYFAAAIIVALSVVLADLSYRFVEDPIRKAGLKTWLTGIVRRLRALNPARTASQLAIPTIVLCLALAGIITAPAVSSGQQAVEEGRVTLDEPPGGGNGATDPGANPGNTSGPETGDETPEETGGSDVDEPDVEDSNGSDPSSAPEAEPEPTESPEPTGGPDEFHVPEGPASWDEVTILGDSVALAAEYTLGEEMPGAIIDAEESRSIATAPELIAGHAANGTLGEFVVISLATNGEVTDADVDAIVEAVGPDRTVILVTAFGPARASWIPDSNDAIAGAPGRYPGRVYVADWHDAIEHRTDLLAGDAIHPGREGATVYAQTIKKTLNEDSAN